MNAQPRLVIDRDTGNLCIQLCVGSHSATLPLPKGMQLSDRLGIQAFMEVYVPKMMLGLNERRRAEMKKTLKRKDKGEAVPQSPSEDARQELVYDTTECDPGPNAGAEAAPDGSTGVPYLVGQDHSRGDDQS